MYYMEDDHWQINTNEHYTEYVRRDPECVEGILNAIAASQIAREFGHVCDSDHELFLSGYSTGKAFMIRCLRNYILNTANRGVTIEPEDIQIDILDTTDINVTVKGTKVKFPVLISDTE